jgi:hypothetical protein
MEIKIHIENRCNNPSVENAGVTIHVKPKSCNNLAAGRSRSRHKNQHTNQLEFFTLFNIRAHSAGRAPAVDKLINARAKSPPERESE